MRICLDLRTTVGPMHGIARYGVELARALQKLDHSHKFFLLTGNRSPFDPGEVPSAEVLGSAVRPYTFMEQIWVPCILDRLQVDLYHCLTYACPAVVRQPFLLTVHDLLPLVRRQEFAMSRRAYFQTVVRLAARRSRRIIVVSDYTKSCMARWFRRTIGKTRVVSSGGDHITKTQVTPEDERRFLVIIPEKSPFFLSVANSRLHKNILFSVRCFSRMVQETGVGFQYVLVGSQHPEVYSYLEQCPARKQIRFAGQVTDGLLRILYERAIALLFPSLGEGFGLPVAEAMQFGLPVIAFQDGAVSELLGGTGVVLPGQEVRDWKDAMWGIYQRRTRGDWDPNPVQERAREHTWLRAAEQTMAIYEEVSEEQNTPCSGRGGGVAC